MGGADTPRRRVRGTGAVGARAVRTATRPRPTSASRCCIAASRSSISRPPGTSRCADPTGRCWITYNGEVYNYVELRDGAAKARATLRHRHSDTEVILAAYARWGHDCLSRFNGMFAFAIWDGARRDAVLSRATASA